ncbi:MAG: 2-dehydropantoate 2-reductase [Quisquiliibacterium sp.]
MNQASSWISGARAPRIAVFGAGAVGCFYGAKLAQSGATVTLIARQAHVQAIGRAGLVFESGGKTVPVAIAADATPQPLRDADIVLLCVKTLDTESAARQIAELAHPDAVVVSMQNGVDNVERIAQSAGIDALASVVYVAASMPAAGHLRHAGRGDLILGEYGAAPPGAIRLAGRAPAVAALFESAGIACPVSDDVRSALWGKLVVNCAYNPVSALGNVRYGLMVGDAPTRTLMGEIVAECHAVASADGVNLPPLDKLLADVIAVGHAMAPATSSTQQDLARGKLTEIDSLNGYVVRRGAALGVPTPINRALQALVHLREKSS